jgi:hypothetical protein
MQQWAMLAVSLFVGICGGVIGAYAGMMVGLGKLEVHKDYMRERINGMDARMNETDKSNAVYHEDVRILDFEMEDVMRVLNIPRKKRQNWRFET